MSLPDTEAEGLARQMVMDDPLVWLEGYPLIENEQKQLVKPVANVLQQRIGMFIRYCRKHKLPIRAVIPKPRRRGISTVTVGASQWLQKVMPRDMLVMGGKKWQVDSLWTMYKRFAETDTFPWGFDGYVMETRAEWGNGSTTRQETAKGDAPGRSGGFQILICTEVAYWGHDDAVRNAAGVLQGVLACVRDDPDTMIFIESTSAGGSGLFYRRCMDAVSLEDFLRGERSTSGFVRIFAGVFEFDDCRLPVRDAQEEMDILNGIGARNEAERQRERQLRLEHRLDAGQIKYWRKLLSDCDNDPEKRDKDYPPDLESAFRAAQPCRFSLGYLREMRDEALAAQEQIQWGVLEQPDQRAQSYVWRFVAQGRAPQPGEKMVYPEGATIGIWEQPRHGFRYSISVDNASGKAPTKGGDTDCHAVTVWREGYFDGKGKWVRRAIVAAIKPQQRVDIDILAEWVMQLHHHYGRCLVVPEANNDAGLIAILRKAGVVIYEQEQPATKTNSQKPSGRLGFWTRGGEHEATRRWIIEQMARAVREKETPGEGIFCPFLWILDEMEHFATDPDTGRAEAMPDWHDDWVMAACIGNATMAGATVYVLPRHPDEPPPEVRNWERRGRDAFQRPGDEV